MNINDFMNNIYTPTVNYYQNTGTLPSTCPLMTAAQSEASAGNFVVARANDVAALQARELTDPIANLIPYLVKDAFYQLGNNNIALTGNSLTEVSDFIQTTFVYPLMNLATKAALAVSTTEIDLTQPVPDAAIIAQVDKVYGLAQNIAIIVQQQMVTLSYRLTVMLDMLNHASLVTPDPARLLVYNNAQAALNTLCTSVIAAVYGPAAVTALYANTNIFTLGQTIPGCIVNLVNQIDTAINTYKSYSKALPYSNTPGSQRQTGTIVDTCMHDLLNNLTAIQTAFTTFNTTLGVSDFLALLAQPTASAISGPLNILSNSITCSTDLGPSVTGSSTPGILMFVPRNVANFGVNNVFPVQITATNWTTATSSKAALINDFQFTGCDIQANTGGGVNYESVMTYLNLFLSSTVESANQYANLANPANLNAIFGVNSPIARGDVTPLQLSIQTVSDPNLYGAIPIANSIVSSTTFISDLNGTLVLNAPLWGIGAMQLPTIRANNLLNFFEETYNLVTSTPSVISTQIASALHNLPAIAQIAKVKIFANAFFTSVANQPASKIKLNNLWMGLMQAFGLDPCNNLVSTPPLPQMVSNFVSTMISQTNLTNEELLTIAADTKCGLGGVSDRSDVMTKLISNSVAQLNFWVHKPQVANAPDIGTSILANELNVLNSFLK